MLAKINPTPPQSGKPGCRCAILISTATANLSRKTAGTRASSVAYIHR